MQPLIRRAPNLHPTRSRTGWAPLALLWLGVLGLASADVVHLTSGRRITGEVVKETDSEVVVRVAGSGRVKFPRKLVRKIVRESQGATRLALARQRSREGAWEKAQQLYEAALKDPDPAVAKAARLELDELLAARAKARAQAPRPRPSTPGSKPAPSRPQGSGKTGGGDTSSPLQVGLAALRAGRIPEARSIFLKLLKQSPTSTRYAYLAARAYELGGHSQEAAKRYTRLVGELGKRRDLTTPWLGEIARRKLGGEALTTDSPGVGAGWNRLEASSRFVIYHPFPKIEAWLQTEPEKSLKHVLKRLELDPGKLAWNGRVQIFLFPNKRAYEEAEGMKLAGGHAQQYPAPDGRLIQIRAYPLRTFYQNTIPHEIAHAVLWNLVPNLPSWAHEGAAQFVESPRSRARSRGAMRGATSTGTLSTWPDLLAGKVPRGSNKAEVAAYYGQAQVAFEALVELSGGTKDALTWCQEIARTGGSATLKRHGVSWRQFEAAAEQASQNTSAGD